ncbi:hypothetical protein P7K49_020335 [Saguinus oedipus]|uniref:Uncharacterized protein n=1 Tax=Saguinus oedipus TaxID=9490 RepID=A0ABQ9V1S0_SAGOE|nr:hypothetical protein P7K49_020335 [Saguinus oedipus]
MPGSPAEPNDVTPGGRVLLMGLEPCEMHRGPLHRPTASPGFSQPEMQPPAWKGLCQHQPAGKMERAAQELRQRGIRCRPTGLVHRQASFGTNLTGQENASRTSPRAGFSPAQGFMRDEQAWALHLGLPGLRNGSLLSQAHTVE